MILKLTSFSCKWTFVNLRYPTGAISSLEFTIVSYSSLRHKTKWNKKNLFRLYIHKNGNILTYITILLANKGQSKVNVSYSPPSPHIFTPYFSFYK